MRNFLRVLLMILISPIEFGLALIWLALWLITLPFDMLWDKTIQKSVKDNLLK